MTNAWNKPMAFESPRPATATRTREVSNHGSRIPSEKEEALLVPLLSLPQKFECAFLITIWLACLCNFWTWWLEPRHNIGTASYAVTTLVLGWLSLLPLYFIGIFFRGLISNNRRPVSRDDHVAMVVTKAPSEPFPVVRETLEAMLRQPHPHDTWLADEDPAPETVAWCAEHDVKISTRKGQTDYHRTTWPRRTRCKEGNLAFFYDHYGYDTYDLVVQLDADHVPTLNYLEEMLRPFTDPAVGYVSAPSICDKNAAESWSARGRLYAEGMLHGALQAGYTNGLAPLCIGSHYAVRTKALREIGGLGPELAEDHSTTLFMNAYGWRGVHAFDAIAHGEGPRTFADMVTQEFQWSRSLVMILLQYTPGLLQRLPLRFKLQFLFCQLWYPLFSLVMSVMYLIPIIALLFDVNMVGVTYPEFLFHFGLSTVALLMIVARLTRMGLSRPVDCKVISWESTLFLFARWPWSLLGTLAAFRDWWIGTTVDFRVTPKGTDSAAPLPFRVIAPYVLLALGAGLPVLIIDDIQNAGGFYILALVNCLIYTVLLIAILIKHSEENPKANAASFDATGLVRASLVTALIMIPAVGVPQRMPQGLSAILLGADLVLDQFAIRVPIGGTDEALPY